MTEQVKLLYVKVCAGGVVVVVVVVVGVVVVVVVVAGVVVVVVIVVVVVVGAGGELVSLAVVRGSLFFGSFVGVSVLEGGFDVEPPVGHF